MTSEIAGASAYSRMPERFAELDPQLRASQSDDDFGIIERFAAIREILEGSDLGTMVDLGGHSGYFSLSLLDLGMAKSSTVYDLNQKALAVGRTTADQMKIRDIEFIEQSVDYGFLKAIAPVDTILCLNLLHHAGAQFDVAIVEREGWERYALSWLKELHEKSRVVILSLAFKGRSKPRYWGVPPFFRPFRFAQLASQAGWRIRYEANIYDIRRLGTRRSERRYTSSRPMTIIRFGVRKLENAVKRLIGIRIEKLQWYHLYILEH